METLMTLIAENFWYIFLILALLKHLKGWGILLLCVHVVFGYVNWIYVVVCTAALANVGWQWLKKTYIDVTKSDDDKDEDELDPDYQ